MREVYSMDNTCHKSSFEKSVASGLHQAWSRMWNTACRAHPVTANSLMDRARLLRVVIMAVSNKANLSAGEDRITGPLRWRLL
jgi:hypothetical protein